MPSIATKQFISEKGQISFFSSTALEDIEACITKAKSLFDVSDRLLAFSVPIQSFVFDKSLMRKHFNESYLESEKYPKTTFKGTEAASIRREGSKK